MPNVEFTSTIPGLELAWPVLPTSQLSPADRKRYPMHMCPGIHDWNTTGYVIRAWTDFYFEKSGPEEFRVHFNDREHDFSKSGVGRLDAKMIPFNFDNDMEPNVFKIDIPWLIKTPANYSCIMVSPFYHFLDNVSYIMTYPGIVDTDGLHKPSWIFSVLKNESFIIPRGAPILQIIPFKREKFISRVVRGNLGDWLGQSLKMTRAVAHWYWKKFHVKKEFL